MQMDWWFLILMREYWIYNQWNVINIVFYYIDMSVLLWNMPLADFIWNYIRDTSDIFSIFSLMFKDIADVIPLFFPRVLQNKDTFGDHFRLVFFLIFDTHICVIKSKLHVCLNIWSLSSCGKKISLISCAHSKIYFICSRHRVIYSM